MKLVTALITGLIFGLGLAISGMINPAKVQNFLDIFGNFDPSLIFVMGGAILVAAPGFYFLKAKEKPLVESSFNWPQAQSIDRKLLAGASLFGVGWGLSGFCPGPAIAGLAIGNIGTIVFVLSMLVGMWLIKLRQAV